MDTLTLHADLFPTLTAQTGTMTPPTVQGTDFGALLAGGDGPHRQTVHAAYLGLQRMASDGRHKLIRYQTWYGRGTEALQLFNLATDPAELTNLAQDSAYSPVVERLSNSLANWQQRSNDPYPFTIRPAHR